jgi:hypothetical protein
MTKADLLKWVASHSPPLTGKCPVVKDSTNPPFKTDYNRFNAVINATTAKAVLLSRSPPLTAKDVNDAMVEYNK